RFKAKDEGHIVTRSFTRPFIGRASHASSKADESTSDPRKPAAYRYTRVAVGDGAGTYGGCGADCQPWPAYGGARNRADDRDRRQDSGPRARRGRRQGAVDARTRYGARRGDDRHRGPFAER